jgi:hypothetical protein
VGEDGPLLPPRPKHPLGCHNPRVPDRAAMDAIFFVLRTGCQWNALKETRICSSSSAHRRFQEWTKADPNHEFFEVTGMTRQGWCAKKWTIPWVGKSPREIVHGPGVVPDLAVLSG